MGLFLFWCIFFRKFIFSPYDFATSDHMSTYFSSWRYFGQQLRKRESLHDPYHFGSVSGIPFTCVWYPVHLITGLVGSFMSLNMSFIFYTGQLLLHYFLASIFAYILFGNLFMAITLAYAMRAINLNQSIVYSWCWTLGAIATGNPLCLFLAVAGGYWPIVLFACPFVLMSMGLEALFVAGLLCLPQLIITLRYMKSSVRAKASYESRSLGSVHPILLLSYAWPMRLNHNGVLYPELSFGIGRIALLIALFAPISLYTAIALVGVYLMLGKYVKAPIIGRIPARASYMVTIALCFMANPIVSTMGYNLYVVLLLLQAWDIIHNHSPLILFEPFMEHASKPSHQYDIAITDFLKNRVGSYRVSGLLHPLFAGHISGIRGLGYCGGMMTLKNAKERGIRDMNGAGDAHDWFAYKEDGVELDRYGIKYALFPPEEKLIPGKWQRTDIIGLWENTCLPHPN